MTEPTGAVDPDDDLAAELDDDDHDPAGAGAGADAALPPARFYAGIAEGGPDPYPGKLIISRFPSGVLLVDKGGHRVWVFDFDGAGGLYRCRDDAGALLDYEGRWRAAEGPTYEVRAYDPDFGGDEAPTAADTPGGGDLAVTP